MLSVVPIMNPANPMQAIRKFRKSIHALRPPVVVSYHRVQMSKIGGNSTPNVDNANAPTNSMKMPKSGIATANTTIQFAKK